MVGVAVQRPQWHRDADRFLKPHRQQPAPVAVHGMGPRTDEAEASLRSQTNSIHPPVALQLPAHAATDRPVRAQTDLRSRSRTRRLLDVASLTSRSRTQRRSRPRPPHRNPVRSGRSPPGSLNRRSAASTALMERRLPEPTQGPARHHARYVLAGEAGEPHALIDLRPHVRPNPQAKSTLKITLDTSRKSRNRPCGQIPTEHDGARNAANLPDTAVPDTPLAK